MHVAAITGASSGIGQEVARLLFKNGYSLVLGSRNIVALEGLLREIRAGDKGIAIKLDVSNFEDIKHFIGEALRVYGKIDVLVNNAGLGLYGPFHEANPRDIEYVIDVNLTGPIMLARLTVPHMISRRKGCIVNVSSLAALAPTPWFAVYSSAKAGLKLFTDTLRMELKPYGIRVIGVYPGYVRTNFFRNLLKTPIVQRHELKVLPPGPVLKPTEVAKKIVKAIVGKKNGDVYIGLLNKLAKEGVIHMPRISSMYIEYFYRSALKKAGML